MTRLLLALAFAALAVWLARRDRAVPAREGWLKALDDLAPDGTRVVWNTASVSTHRSDVRNAPSVTLDPMAQPWLDQ